MWTGNRNICADVIKVYCEAIQHLKKCIEDYEEYAY